MPVHGSVAMPVVGRSSTSPASAFWLFAKAAVPAPISSATSPTLVMTQPTWLLYSACSPTPSDFTPVGLLSTASADGKFGSKRSRSHAVSGSARPSESTPSARRIFILEFLISVAHPHAEGELTRVRIDGEVHTALHRVRAEHVDLGVVARVVRPRVRFAATALDGCIAEPQPAGPVADVVGERQLAQLHVRGILDVWLEHALNARARVLRDLAPRDLLRERARRERIHDADRLVPHVVAEHAVEQEVDAHVATDPELVEQ